MWGHRRVIPRLWWGLPARMRKGGNQLDQAAVVGAGAADGELIVEEGGEGLGGELQLGGPEVLGLRTSRPHDCGPGLA